VTRLRIGVLVSGAGTNLQAILDTVHGREGIEVVAVASNKSEAPGLERARTAGVETGVFAAADYASRAERDAAMADWLESRGVGLIVLAGFMEILDVSFVRRFAGRMINVHPSLLPAFQGVNPIEQTLDYGVRITGVTVHFVDEGVDTGPIILQEPLELPYAADISGVQTRLHEIEHRLLPEAIRLFARGALRMDPHHPRRVLIDDDQS
jgi:phosphoribosylglycinamide formyltransferase-1